VRCLLPTPADDLDNHAVHLHYAENWRDRGGLRVNFVSSVDGAANAQGKSEGLQTPGDNTVFGALRDLADVVLVGSGTAIAEGYRPTEISDRRQGVRRDFGFPPALPTAIISRSLAIDPSNPLFTSPPAGARTIVLTCEAAPADRRAGLPAAVDIAICGDDSIDPRLARAALVERGLTRILSEGGPSTYARMAQVPEVIDELCLSLTPMLTGPGAGRIVSGVGWPDVQRLRLTGLLEEDSALFLRYSST
jgi:riboflavin biosynthesis pyrimidine reductase